MVPAAGVGRRMGGNTPKQYLQLAGKTVIEHTLDRLLTHPQIAGVCVALSEGDPYWPQLPIAKVPKILLADGGRERCDSVLSGLNRLTDVAAEDDWVLVHDAARPCLRPGDIDKLIAESQASGVGGILAVPVHDTVKQAGAAGDTIEKTVPRERLWRAFTPQMFRLQQLRAALVAALEKGAVVTDEASAMEMAGYHPRLVEGAVDNIKITRPEDLPLAEYYLSQSVME